MKKKSFLAVLCVAFAVMFALASCGKTNKPGNDGEYTLELEPGCKQVTIYYNRAAGYADCDVWFWAVDGEGGVQTFHPCEYGAKIVVNVPDTTLKVGYIIRTNVTPGSSSWDGAQKDGTDSDRYFTLTGDYTVVYTKAGDPATYTSTDGGKTLEIMRNISLADMQDLKHIKVTISDNSQIAAEDITVKNSKGETVAFSSVNGNIITFPENLSVSEAYTLNVTGFDPVGVVPMSYFSSASFATAYNYTGELGVEIDKENSATTFRLWAPTASGVTLNLYSEGNFGAAYKVIPMERGEKGVWTHVADSDLSGNYYTYSVTTSMGTQEAVDPYARSTGANGERGMILDLDTTDPDNWTAEPFEVDGVENYTDAQIWEVHIRDFSNKIASSQYKGKYLAFTETGLTNKNGVPVGVDYLKNLGITYVHLLPSFDYASVDETADEGFNWGYDPLNYNVPEGSYSTDPYDGAVRVNEYKQMVQALHAQGIGVVMDVVYNHTFSADSNFNKIVPYYYYRYNGDGTLSNGSGCGNEMASDRAMVRKFMIDSVTYWQKEYNLDGFRFDLMALHDMTTMQEIEKAVHAINPKALIYGEGWTGGGSTLAGNKQSTLANLAALNKKTSNLGTNGVAMFNDVIRDGVKGSVFNIDDTGFATGAKTGYINNVLFGATGSTKNDALYKLGDGQWYASNPTQVVNYVSAHDNNTLWDRICHVYGEEAATLEKRLKMNRLSAAIVQTSLGIPFMQAGEEMLRAKKNEDGTYNENSYNASDEVNNIQWDLLSENSDQYKMAEYYKGLIAFRKSSPALRQIVANSGRNFVCNLVVKNKALVAFTVENLEDASEKLLVVWNAEETAGSVTLPAGSWDLYVNGTAAGATALQTGLTGAQNIEGISCYVYKYSVKA